MSVPKTHAFTRFASHAATLAGRDGAAPPAMLLVAAWVVAGALVRFSEPGSSSPAPARVSSPS